jgi:hypothetical protein
MSQEVAPAASSAALRQANAGLFAMIALDVAFDASQVVALAAELAFVCTASTGTIKNNPNSYRAVAFH